MSTSSTKRALPACWTDSSPAWGSTPLRAAISTSGSRCTNSRRALSHVGVERRSNRTTLPRDGVDDASYGVPCNACSGDWSSKDDCSTVDSSGRAEYSSSAATMPLSKVATVALIHVPNSQSIARSKLDLRKIAETRNPRLQPLHDVHANALPYAHAHVDVRCDSRTGKVPVCSDHLALKNLQNR